MNRNAAPTSILFVCMGNICRSPLAEGIARVELREAGFANIRLDSAGTHDYHTGAPPDERARRVGREIGCPIDDLRARRVEAGDFSRFDLILAADQANLAWLRQHSITTHAHIDLLLPWCGAVAGSQVPDPYYGQIEDFHRVAELLRSVMPGLVSRLREPA